MVIETRAEQSRASSPRLPAVAYCQGTVLRNEIEARDAGKLEAATDYAASAIADRHGSGEVAAKIQAHVIVAAGHAGRVAETGEVGVLGAFERLHGDDTTVPVLAKGKTDTGRLWVYVRDNAPFGGAGPPAAIFYYSRDRRGEHPQSHLAGYSGILQADAYDGYNRLYLPDRKPGPIKEGACWAHARRPFFAMADIEANARRKAAGKKEIPLSPIAMEIVRRIDALFAIERSINGKSAEERLAVRQAVSRPLVDALENYMRDQVAKLSRGHDLAARRKLCDIALKIPLGFLAVGWGSQRDLPHAAREKRLDVVIEGVRRSRHADRIQLVVTGRGPEEEAIRRRAATLPLPAEVGFVDDAELLRLLRTADLLVHASEVELEGMAVLEALACGTPALVARAPRSAVRQFALSEDFLFSPGDPDDLARRLDALLDAPERLGAARPAALARADGFRFEDSVRRLEALYLRVARPAAG